MCDCDPMFELCLNKVVPIIKQVANRDMYSFSVEEKEGRGNFVTSLDKSFQDELVAELSKIDPSYGFISEEEVHDKKDINWVIDPIDGTCNFLHNLPCTISVALVDNDEPLLGVVYEILSGNYFLAVKGHGAFRYETIVKGAFRGEKYFKPVEISENNSGIAISGFPYDKNKTSKALSVIEKSLSISDGLRIIGPASLDICKVADGTAKLYFEWDLKPWDYAAASLVLSEAGGTFLQKDDLFIFGSDFSTKQFLEMLEC